MYCIHETEICHIYMYKYMCISLTKYITTLGIHLYIISTKDEKIHQDCYVQYKIKLSFQQNQCLT